MIQQLSLSRRPDFHQSVTTPITTKQFDHSLAFLRHRNMSVNLRRLNIRVTEQGLNLSDVSDRL
jgi:hypothetical protein